MLHVRCTAFWMQTSGVTLIMGRRRSLARTWMLANGSSSVYELLYLAAVRGDWRAPLSVATVTHLVTRSPVSPGRVVGLTRLVTHVRRGWPPVVTRLLAYVSMRA